MALERYQNIFDFPIVSSITSALVLILNRRVSKAGLEFIDGYELVGRRLR